jgi:hypothetical protein
VFGFLRRSRVRKPAQQPVPANPPAVADEKQDEEPPVRSWFSSSLDLHKGLDVSDASDDTTEPMPLSESEAREKREKR